MVRLAVIRTCGTYRERENGQGFFIWRGKIVGTTWSNVKEWEREKRVSKDPFNLIPHRNNLRFFSLSLSSLLFPYSTGSLFCSFTSTLIHVWGKGGVLEVESLMPCIKWKSFYKSMKEVERFIYEQSKFLKLAKPRPRSSRQRKCQRPFPIRYKLECNPTVKEKKIQKAISR